MYLREVARPLLIYTKEKNMANSDRPKGFEPVGEVKRVNPYVADAACYPGDVLERTATGKVQPIADGAVGTQIVGVAASYAAADGDEVMVYDDPNQLYRVQADGADVDAQTDLGTNYDILNTAGNSTYKISRMELDSDTAATTAATPLILIRIESADDNALGANVDCIVKLNMHVYEGAITGSTGTTP